MSVLGLNDFVAVRAALGQRVADARFLARGRHNEAEAADSESMIAGAGAVDVLPSVFHLTYEDVGGLVSQRVVTVRSIGKNAGGGLYVKCRCHLRGSSRTFALERVLEGFDATTGEVFTDASAFFSAHPIFSPASDPEGQALDACRHEINLLTVVGASDGLFDPDEQDVLLVHLFDRNDHLALDENRLRSLLALVAPDAKAFDGSLRQLALGAASDLRLLRRGLRKLVDADGRISPEEVRFVAEIEARLPAA